MTTDEKLNRLLKQQAALDRKVMALAADVLKIRGLLIVLATDPDALAEMRAEDLTALLATADPFRKLRPKPPNNGQTSL